MRMYIFSINLTTIVLALALYRARCTDDDNLPSTKVRTRTCLVWSRLPLGTLQAQAKESSPSEDNYASDLHLLCFLLISHRFFASREATGFLCGRSVYVMDHKKIAKRRRPVDVIRPGPEGKLLLPDNAGSVIYVRDFLSKAEADELMQETKEARSWARTPITFFGKSVLQPRDTAFFGTRLYSYSDERRMPTGWDEDPPASTALKRLGTHIEEYLELPKDWFNVILANRYLHGKDFMGWHSDNEKSLGEEPIIASISLGAERRFLIRNKGDGQEGKPREKIEYVLAHGSLLVMTGSMQKSYQHSLPKVALLKCDKLRLNFTYRRVEDESDHRKG